MAHIRFKDGHRKVIADNTARRMWLCLNGYADCDSEQRSYLEQVTDVVMDYRVAPDEYIRRNFTRIVPLVLSSWMVDMNGRPVRPATRDDYLFAEKWGLWVKDRPSALVIDPPVQQQLV